MKLVLQYVSKAKVTVGEKTVGKIGRGYAVLVGIGKDDTLKKLQEITQKLLALRTIPDQEGNINLSIHDIEGDILLIPQFTLYADTGRGHRPSFSKAMPPREAKELFDRFVSMVEESNLKVETGEFGALMDVTVTNAGPITILLEN